MRRGALAGVVVALGMAAAATSLVRAAGAPATRSVESASSPPSSRDAGVPSTTLTTPVPAPARVPLVELGRALFFDPELSEPPGTSCSNCHDPDRAFSGTNGSRSGVPAGSRAGHLARRSAPSLLYLKYVPKFHFYQDDDAVEPAAFGGFFWNGRADTIADVVREPLVNPDEMNNRDVAMVARKVAAASYAGEFRAELAGAEGNPGATMKVVGAALEAFLTADEMAPFTSRFDAFASGRGKLTPYELEGMRLFQDPAKGGCVACHRFYEKSRDPSLSMFTDFGYDALGVPANPALPRDRRPDLGLCERRDEVTPSSAPKYCVSFRTPSLRNVAVLGSFMHNGAFTELRRVVEFYATRATNPGRWYHSGVRFEDTPERFRGRVNIASIPYNRHEGDTPALSEPEIDAVVAFLRTLTDARYERSHAP